MATFTVTVVNVEPHWRNGAKIAHVLKDETFELEEYGEVEAVALDGDTATVTMTGATEEVATRMDGYIYRGVPD